MIDREAHDIEITMHAFRMMRNGHYRKATQLLKDLKEDFPEIPEERLKSVMAKLCRKLMENE